MAETKGITISFYGDTANFDKSVDGINKALKKTQQELSQVNKSLKFEPQSAEKLQRQFELLSQKQSLLKESIQTYKNELEKLGSYDSLNEDQKKQWESLQKSIANAENELAKVNKQLDYMKGKDLREFAKQMEDIGKNLNNVGKSIEGIGKKFAVLSGTITGLATSGVMYNAELERQTALFTVLTGSVEEAEKVLSNIKQDAIKSPFDTQALISANQYLIASGIEADKTRETINALGNAIASTGGGNSELQRMAQNLQQIQNVGKASTIDIRQFAMAGIDIWGILADSTGKSVAELQNMTITYDMLSEALVKASEEGGRYAGGMEAQADTLNGKISKLKSTFQELLGELTEVLVPVIKNIVDTMQSWIDMLKNLDDEQKQTITRIAGIVASIGPVLIIIGKITTAVGGLMTMVSGLLKNQAIINLFTAIQSAGGGLSGLLTTIGSKIGLLGGVIGAVAVAFGVLYAKNENFRNSVNGLVSDIGKKVISIFKSFKNALTPVIESLQNLWNTIKSLLAPVFKMIGDILSSVIEVFRAIANVIFAFVKPAIDGLFNLFGNLISRIIDLASGLLNKLKPAFDLIASVGQLVSNVFKIIANAVTSLVQPAFNAMSGIVQHLVDDFKQIVGWVQELYNKFANTSWGQGFINIINQIKNVIESVKASFSWLTDFIDKLISKTNTVIGQQGQLSSGNGSGGRRMDMLKSGGIGLTMNIHVDNNGTPIDENEINRWVDTMTDRLDLALGRRL